MSVPELLTVLVVLAILAGLAIMATRGPRARADLARLNAEAYNLQLAQEAYRSDYGQPYNGPFTADATRAAGFTYTPPPDVTITVESTDPEAWQATLTAAQIDPGMKTSQPSCRLSLSGGENITCMLSGAFQEHLPTDQPAGEPKDPERIPSNGN